eukprot:14006119-Alexandrium_andersonii.AAC.1
MSASLVGSEMCIRDRQQHPQSRHQQERWRIGEPPAPASDCDTPGQAAPCLLYTSDAADDM